VQRDSKLASRIRLCSRFKQYSAVALEDDVYDKHGRERKKESNGQNSKDLAQAIMMTSTMFVRFLQELKRTSGSAVNTRGQ
jgi:hypothetical protein